VSAFGDAFNAVRQVVLLHARVETMDQRITSLAADMDGLTEVLGGLRDRVARLEGIIEGLGMAGAASRAKLPRE
jgi:hypothetical protein